MNEASTARLTAGGGGAWRQGLEFDVRGLIFVMPNAGTSTPSPDGLRFVRIQSLLAMTVGKAKFSEVTWPFCGRVAEDPNALPLEV